MLGNSPIMKEQKIPHYLQLTKMPVLSIIMVEIYPWRIVK